MPKASDGVAGPVVCRCFAFTANDNRSLQEPVGLEPDFLPLVVADTTSWTYSPGDLCHGPIFYGDPILPTHNSRAIPGAVVSTAHCVWSCNEDLGVLLNRFVRFSRLWLQI